MWGAGSGGSRRCRDGRERSLVLQWHPRTIDGVAGRRAGGFCEGGKRVLARCHGRAASPACALARACSPTCRSVAVCCAGSSGRRGVAGCVDLRSNAQGRRKQSTIVVYIQMPAAGRVGARSESGVSAVVFRPGTVIYFVEIGLTFDVWCWRWQYRACACSCFAGWCSRVAQAR